MPKAKKKKTIKPLHCPELGECQFKIEEDVEKSKKVSEKEVFGKAKAKTNPPRKKKKSQKTY